MDPIQRALSSMDTDGKFGFLMKAGTVQPFCAAITLFRSHPTDAFHLLSAIGRGRKIIRDRRVCV